MSARPLTPDSQLVQTFCRLAILIRDGDDFRLNRIRSYSIISLLLQGLDENIVPSPLRFYLGDLIVPIFRIFGEVLCGQIHDHAEADRINREFVARVCDAADRITVLATITSVPIRL